MKSLDITFTSDNRDAQAQSLGPGRDGIAAWSATMNGRFVNGAFHSVAGEVPIFAVPGGPAGPMLFARTAITGASYRAVYVTAAGIGAYDGVHHNMTPVSGWQAPDPSKITVTSLNGIVVLNAPPNPPYVVNLSTFAPATIIPGWPSTDSCAAIVGYRYYLVACGINSPGQTWEQLVKWSDAAEPGTLPLTWAPLPENDAGDLILSDVPGAILAAKQMIDSVIIYKASGAFMLQWVGGAAIMQRRFLFSNLGVVNPRAVVAMEKEHVCVIPGDIIVHNGATFKSILEGRFRKWFFERVPAVLWPFVAVHYDPISGEVWAAYPDNASSPKLVEALIWNRYDDSISVRQFTKSSDLFWTQIPGARRSYAGANFSYQSAAGVTYESTTARSSGTAMTCLPDVVANDVRVILLDGNDPQGVQVGARVNDQITAYCERVAIPLGGSDARSLIKRVRPRVTAPPGAILQVQVGAHESPDADVLWGDPVQWVAGETRDVPALSPGRYGALRVSAYGVRFVVEGALIEFTNQGRQ